MGNFEWAMVLKALILPSIIGILWLLIPAGKMKTSLFRERPWNIWAWIIGGSLFWFAFGMAAYDILTGQ